MNHKKKVLLWLTLILLIGSASATDISFTTFFPECADNATATIDSTLRCGAYFLTPNLHLGEGKTLIIDAITGSIYNTGNIILNLATAPFAQVVSADTENADLIEYFKTGMLNIIGAISLPLTAGPIAIGILLYGVISAVIAYCFLLTIEVIKTYLEISTIWLLWREVFRSQSDFPLSMKGTALVIAGFMIVGSIILISLDFSVWRLT